MHALNQATKAKVNFVKRSGTAGRLGKMDPKIAEHFDDDDLEEEYGGTRSSEYDHEHYMRLEEEYWQQQRAAQEQMRADFINLNNEGERESAAESLEAQPQPEPQHGARFDIDRYFEGLSSTIEKTSC